MKICVVNFESTKNSVSRIFSILPYNLHVVKAVTPKNFQVEIISKASFNTSLPNADVYCFGVSLTNYKITTKFAANLLKRGKKVIFGGPWLAKNQKTASKYCTSCVIGETEELWPEICVDLQNNVLRKTYVGEPIDMVNFPAVSRDYTSYFGINNLILSSRGCPYSCSFCDMQNYLGKGVRTRPIEKLMSEIKSIKKEAKGFFSKILFFTDVNIVGNQEFASEFFRRMKHENLKWVAQSSIQIAQDPKLLRSAYESGCRGLYVGYESIEPKNIELFKPQNKGLDYVMLSKRIKKSGIALMGSFILGLDGDTLDTFPKTLRFAYSVNLDMAQFNVLNPLPGTSIYSDLKSKGRLRKKSFVPKNMTYKSLVKNTIKIHNHFYSTYNLLVQLNRSYLEGKPFKQIVSTLFFRHFFRKGHYQCLRDELV